jgi:protein TonB
MLKANNTLPVFIVISCAIHALLWFGQFEILTPEHTTAASKTSRPLQVTLYAPKQKQSAVNPQPEPSQPDREKTSQGKSKPLKRVMVAIKNDSNSQTQNVKKFEYSVGTHTTSASSTSNSLPDPQPIQVNLQTEIADNGKAENNVINPIAAITIDDIKTLTQQQTARITAQLNQAFDQYFNYPRLAQRNGWQGIVKLGLRIESNGQLSHIRLLSTSGFPVLDQAAIETLNRISTLHDVDIWLNGLHFDTVLPIQYKLVDS